VVEATPKGTPDQAGGTVGKLGIGADNDPADIHHVAYGVVGALQSGVEGTWLVVDRTAAYLAGVVSGRESADQLGGPIRVAQIAQQAASISIETLISLVATLSISIGLINLFPYRCWTAAICFSSWPRLSAASRSATASRTSDSG